MQFSMIVAKSVITHARDGMRRDYATYPPRKQPHSVFRLSKREAERYVADHALADTLSEWGINSRWTVKRIPGCNRYYVGFGGPRHSLHDWLPFGFLDEAHRQWLAGTFLTYETEAIEFSPAAIDIPQLRRARGIDPPLVSREVKKTMCWKHCTSTKWNKHTWTETEIVESHSDVTDEYDHRGHPVFRYKCGAFGYDNVSFISRLAALCST